MTTTTLLERALLVVIVLLAVALALSESLRHTRLASHAQRIEQLESDLAYAIEALGQMAADTRRLATPALAAQECHDILAERDRLVRLLFPRG